MRSEFPFEYYCVRRGGAMYFQSVASSVSTWIFLVPLLTLLPGALFKFLPCPNKRVRTALRHRRFWLIYMMTMWTAVLLYGELLVHHMHASSCHYPASQGDDVYHVLLNADPQIVDHWSYSDRSAPLMFVIQLLCDQQLRRSFRAVLRQRPPHLMIVLGDLMWGPRHYTHESQWNDKVDRLSSIFGGVAPSSFPKDEVNKRDAVRGLLKSSSLSGRLVDMWAVPTVATPGNHDLGMFACGQLDLISLWQRDFGPLNFQLVLPGEASIVSVATTVLQDIYCEGHKAAREATNTWLDTVQKRVPGTSTVLVSHIPLSGASRASCGPRARRAFYHLMQRRGVDYQNILDKDISSRLLNIVGPNYTVSGDAHDLCEVVHFDGSREMTLPSFSWMEGSYFHGYGLMTLSGDAPVEINVCFQPQQLMIYMFYAVFGGYSVAFLFILEISRRSKPFSIREPLVMVAYALVVYMMLFFV